MAQLDSASDSDSEGPRFESAWVGHERNLICLPNQVSFNDIRSLSERVIYLRYDIALRAMIYACGRIKERILYHVATKEQYIIPCVSTVYHAA